MSYWDIEAFLSEEQPLEFCFTEDANGMEFLDPSKGISKTVPAETPLHAASWIVSTMRDYVFRDKDEGEVVRVTVPKCFESEKFNSYHAMDTDSRAKLQNINLRDSSQYFFNFYGNIYKIFQKSPNIMEIDKITNILSSRASSIIERASTHQEETKAESRFHGYVESERKVFQEMRLKNAQYQNWECRKV